MFKKFALEEKQLSNFYIENSQHVYYVVGAVNRDSSQSLI